MTTQELDVIRARIDREIGESGTGWTAPDVLRDQVALIAEVDRLRAALDARGEEYCRSCDRYVEYIRPGNGGRS